MEQVRTDLYDRIVDALMDGPALSSSRDCYAEETAMQVSEYVTRRHLGENDER